VDVPKWTSSEAEIEIDYVGMGEPPQIVAYELLSLAEASEVVGLSHDHLRQLARKGAFWGVKKGKTWLTTEKAVRKYLATNPKPGPRKR